MVGNVLEEYQEAVFKLNELCDRIREENKYLRQSLDVIYEKFNVGPDDDLPKEAVPFLAMGESISLTKFASWAYEMRWELKGYYDENAWTPEYYGTDEAQELASICEEIVILINSIESISQGNWNNLFKDCQDLFDYIEKVGDIYTKAADEANEIVKIN